MAAATIASIMVAMQMATKQRKTKIWQLPTIFCTTLATIGIKRMAKGIIIKATTKLLAQL